jgi:hypothetical protein
MSQVNKQEVFEYLSDLREAGLTNMFGAVPWLETQFGIDRTQGRDLLLEWIRSHNKEAA